MSNIWPSARLGDLVENGELSYGIVQPGPHVDSGIPIVRVKDLRSGRIDERVPLRVAPSISARHGRTVLRGGELLVSIVGTVGESAVVPNALAGWNVARAIAVIRPRDVSAQWIQLCLQTSSGGAAMAAVLNTTVQATLNLSDLKRLSISVPPRRERDAITAVMGALDAKIVANDHAHELMDQLCAAHVRKAALSGEPKSLRDVLILSYGKSLPEPHRVQGSVAVYGSGGLTGSHTTALVNRPGVVVGRKGTVGAVYWADGPHFPIDTTYYVEPIEPDMHEILYYILRSAPLGQLNSDSAVPGLNRDEAYAVRVKVPATTTSVELGKILRGHFCWMSAVREESRTLAHLRHEMLPLLMSGKVRVRDAEKKFAEEAV